MIIAPWFFFAGDELAGRRGAFKAIAAKRQ
jgi:hypothetical protein